LNTLSRLLLGLFILSFTTLSAQTKYEKAFISLVKAKQDDGNITSVSKVACSKGDCVVKDLLVDRVDEESGEKSELSFKKVLIKDIATFMEFKERDGVLKEGEKRQFSVIFDDVESDGNNIFFDKKKMAKEFGKKSAIYVYYKRYLDAPTDGKYTLVIQKKKGNVKMHDSGALSTGKFVFGVQSRYMIKGGFEKLQEMSETNPMASLSLIVIESIEINIKNPKGFLRNYLYLSYKEQMSAAKSAEEKQAINTTFYLNGTALVKQKQFSEMVRTNAKMRLSKLAKQDPMFNKILNKNGQLEKKLDAVLAGTSSSIDIKIENPMGLSLGDFFTLFMSYAMQQKLVSDPNIKVSIK